jgi:hypothetical protein
MCGLSLSNQTTEVYKTETDLITWNYQATFNTYKRVKCASGKCGDSCKGSWEAVECNTNYDIHSVEQAQDYAKKLISIGGVA